jgi:hypothetical protein
MPVALLSGLLSYLTWRWYIASHLEALQKPSVIISSLLDIAIIVAASLIVSAGATWAAGTLAGARSNPEDSKKVMLRLFIVLSASVFSGAFMLAIPTSSPPLPMVEIDIKDKDKDAVGRLLTHTDGFWYVFEEQDDQQKSRLTAIPDDEVKTAWVSKVPE